MKVTRDVCKMSLTIHGCSTFSSLWCLNGHKTGIEWTVYNTMHSEWAVHIFAIIIEIIFNKGFLLQRFGCIDVKLWCEKKPFIVLENLYSLHLHWFVEWFLFFLCINSCYFPSEISTTLCSVYEISFFLVMLLKSDIKLFLFTRLM